MESACACKNQLVQNIENRGKHGHFTFLLICPKIYRMTCFFGTEGVCYHKNNANNPLNVYMNYPIMSSLKVKLTPKSESKLYKYNKILK